MTDGMGTTQYKYKPVSVPGALQIDSVDGPWANDVVAYAYDSLGRVLSYSIGGSRSSVVYDSLGRVVTDSNALGKFSFGYVAGTGRIDSLAYPNGSNAIFSYFDKSGDFRLKRIRNRDPGMDIISQFDYEYDPEGQIRTWSRRYGSEDGSTFHFENDAVNQLVAATLKNSVSGAILKTYSYSYDKAGNRKSQQQDSLLHQYDHNNLNQLLSSNGGGKIRFVGTLSEPGTLSIDGNPVAVSPDSTFSTMVRVVADTNIVTLVSQDFSNNADTSRYRLVLPDAGTVNYGYDANGNMISDGQRSFEYDAKNRLVAVTEGVLRSEFRYDGYDRRVEIMEKSSGTVISMKRFLWIGNSIAEERDSTGSTVARRFFANGEQIGAERFYYAKDHLGSIRELTDSSGAAVARYEYDPYGKMEKISGSIDASFGFTGHYFHAVTGLNLTKYRAYNSSIGRWISRDPIEELARRRFSGHPAAPDPVLNEEHMEYDDLALILKSPFLKEEQNLYGYVGNDPINFTDPLGLEEEHTKNKRKSTEGDHQKAQARKNKEKQKKEDRKKGKGPGGKKFKGWRGFPPLMIPYCLIDPSLCKDPPPSC